MSFNSHANFFPTDEPSNTSRISRDDLVSTSALTFVGTTHCQRQVLAKLLSLSSRELEVCVMHLADGLSQKQVASALRISRQAVMKFVRSAVAKVPELEPLRVNFRQKHDKPRVVHLSQLSRRDRQSQHFNADEL